MQNPAHSPRQQQWPQMLQKKVKKNRKHMPGKSLLTGSQRRRCEPVRTSFSGTDKHAL